MNRAFPSSCLFFWTPSPRTVQEAQLTAGADGGHVPRRLPPGTAGASPARVGGASIASSQSALLLNDPGEHRSPLSPPPAPPLSQEHGRRASLGIHTITETRGVLFNKAGPLSSLGLPLGLSSAFLAGMLAFQHHFSRLCWVPRASWQGSRKRFPHTFKDAMPHRSPRGQNSTPPRPSKGRPATETPIRWVLPGQRLRLGGRRGGKETPGKCAWSLQEHPSSEGQGDGTGAQGSVQPPKPQITAPSDVETRSPCVD